MTTQQRELLEWLRAEPGRIIHVREPHELPHETGEAYAYGEGIAKLKVLESKGLVRRLPGPLQRWVAVR